MISGLKEKESTAAPKHGGGTANDMLLISARPWSGLKNPRIVRVPRAFAGKDRHSKVSTIRGLRDRRVRLSVQTALQLYDLQDKLGFNQPSKVVDWLISAAQHEIDKLPPLPFPPESFPHHFCQPPPPPVISDEKTSLNDPTIADAFGAVGSHRNARSTARNEAGDCHLALFSSMANDDSSLRSKVNSCQQLPKFANFGLIGRKLDHHQGGSIRYADAAVYGATAEASANGAAAPNAPSFYQLESSSNLNTFEHSSSSNSLSLVPPSQLVLYASGSAGTLSSMFPPFMTPLSGLHPMQMSHIQGSDSATLLQSSSSIMVRPNSHPRLS